jgi:hypothetical protein
MTREAASRMLAMTALLEPVQPRAAAPRAREHRSGSGRDPAHALYHHAAGVLGSAQSLEAAARVPGVVSATAPTLACLETSLASLATAVGRLRGQALERLSEPVLPSDGLRPERAEIALALERLAGVLDQAAFACGNALGAIEPVHAELRAI